MEASITIPPTGVMVNVIGNSKASAASGPTPGSTPTNVPIRLPKKQKKRLSSVRMMPKPVSSPPTASMPHQPHGPRGSGMPSIRPNNQTTTTMATKASASENHQLDFSTVRSRMTIVMKPATANPRNGMLIAMKASPAMTPRTRHSASPRGKSGAIVSLDDRNSSTTPVPMMIKPATKGNKPLSGPDAPIKPSVHA